MGHNFHAKLATGAEYLRVTPATFKDLRRLYSCYLRAALGQITSARDFRTVGQFLTGEDPLYVALDGMMFMVRPHSEDLGYLLPTHKPVRFGDDWFPKRPGTVFVDVGASIGSFTVRAAQAGMKVLAIEPNPVTFEVLTKNLALNRVADVVVSCNVAVGSEVGFADLHLPRFGSGLATLVHPVGELSNRFSDQRNRVPIATLDRLTATYDRIYLMMIDIEGYELSALLGAPETLSKTERLILEIWHGQNESRVKDLLYRAGFHFVERRSQHPLSDYWLYLRD